MKNTHFLPTCDLETEELILSAHDPATASADLKKKLLSRRKIIMPLFDGVAFDFELKSYCKGSGKMLEFQKKHTFMKQNKEAIAIAKATPEAQYAEQLNSHNPMPEPISPVEKEISDKVCIIFW